MIWINIVKFSEKSVTYIALYSAFSRYKSLLRHNKRVIYVIILPGHVSLKYFLKSCYRILNEQVRYPLTHTLYRLSIKIKSIRQTATFLMKPLNIVNFFFKTSRGFILNLRRLCAKQSNMIRIIFASIIILIIKN